MTYHESLAQGRWFGFTFFEQMGNIASETGRMVRSKDANERNFIQAFARALELIDLTRSDPRWQSPSRLKELSRLREFLCADAVGKGEFDVDLSYLDSYLMQFAKAARQRA
jgi:hypothetical protein